MSNIPKLRFPEFKGEWEEKRIDSIFDEKKEKNHPSEEVLTIIQGTGTVPRKASGRNIIFDEKSLSSYKFVQKDDFIIHLRSFEGGLEIANSNGIVSPAYIIMHPKLLIASKFYYSYFRSYKFINHVLPVSVEGVRDGRQIKYPILKEEKIPFTSFAEQQKIADFLSNVDSIITAETKILNTLQKKKKALMQKLFTQQLRFKSDDGTDFPEWEEKKVIDFAKVDTGANNTQAKVEDGPYPFYVRSPIIYRSNKYIFDFPEAVLTVGDGVGTGKVFHYVQGKFDCHQRVYVIHDFENVLGKYFYFYFSEKFYARVKPMSAKNSVDSVRREMITDMKIPIPCKAEQQKIADCLSSLDSLIQTQQKVVTTWQQRKKALLQQMFI